MLLQLKFSKPGNRQEEKRMKSDSVKKGMQTAPQRSLFNALGMTKEELTISDKDQKWGSFAEYKNR
mgnify:CR=1 FL=1